MLWFWSAPLLLVGLAVVATGVVDGVAAVVANASAAAILFHLNSSS